MDPTEHAAGIRRELSGWFRRNARDLPWRSERSLYRTVVSEFMLQQTQVKTVLPHFERWVRRFPGFAELAAAEPDAVLKSWEGLGYYRRARNLHRLAKEVADLPEPPLTAEDWSRLPGVGAYTAAAIASIAQGYPAAVVDGNVVRILARLCGDEREFTAAKAVKAFSPLARDLLDTKDPGTHNEAMMELGATVCLKRVPLCGSCPLSEYCTAKRRGNPEAFPRITRPATVAVETTRLWIHRGNRLLLYRIPENATRLAGQFELPQVEPPGDEPLEGTVRGVRRRGITRYRIAETILQPRWTRTLERDLARDDNLQWIATDQLGQITLSGPHRRWVQEFLEEDLRNGNAPRD